MKGQGDRLAQGATRANFHMTDGHLDDKKWEQAFGNFDPKAFKKLPNKARQRQPVQLELPLS
jgi:hypothetical protein